jgi:hypothetical protein
MAEKLRAAARQALREAYADGVLEVFRRYWRPKNSASPLPGGHHRLRVLAGLE